MGTDMVTISASVLEGALTTRAKVVLGWFDFFVSRSSYGISMSLEC
jgi:hypothetical protein